MLFPCPDYGEIFYSYHGTHPEVAKDIAAGNIEVTKGGGELGRGFYSGQYEHEAKAWAFHVSSTTTKNVVMLEQPIVYDFLDFKIKNLDIKQATQTRNNLKASDTKRTYLFEVDIVISKIIGTTKTSGCQLKWESMFSEDYLNSNKTIRSIIW